MKKTLLLASAAIATLAMQAKTVTPAQALSEASQFCQTRVEKGVMRAPKLNANMKIAYTNPDGGYYVVNRGNGAGYVIVAGDDCSPMILGYSNSGDFDYNAIPDNKKSWLNSYAKQVAASAKAGITYKAESTTDHAKIANLLKTSWGQDAPYNELCPYYYLDSTSNKHCPTGCVATAMAQVLNYHQWPAQAKGTGTAKYQKNVMQTVTLPSIDMSGDIFAWDKMLNKYDTLGTSTAEERAAVQLLMRDCGYSVDMVYENSSSGASSMRVPIALIENFGYDKSAHSVARDWYTAAQWDSIVYKELSTNGPVLYRGSTEANEGHQFVCDGYNGDGYYHFNWGWNGLADDDYFLLSALNPKVQGTGGSVECMAFDFDQDIVIDVKKPQEGSSYVYQLSNYTSMQPDPSKNKIICGIANYSNTSFKGEVGFQVTNEATGESYFSKSDDVSLAVAGAIQSLTDTLTLADGTYRLRTAFKHEGDEWELCKTLPGKVTSVIVTVKDGKKSYSSDIDFAYTSAKVSNVVLFERTNTNFSMAVTGNGGTHTANLWYSVVDMVTNKTIDYSGKTSINFDVSNVNYQATGLAALTSGYDKSHLHSFLLWDGDSVIARADSLKVYGQPRFTIIDSLQVTNALPGNRFYTFEEPYIHFKFINVGQVPFTQFKVATDGEHEGWHDGGQYPFPEKDFGTRVKISGDTITIDGVFDEFAPELMGGYTWTAIFSYPVNESNVFYFGSKEASTVTLYVVDKETGIDGVNETDATIVKSEVYNLQGMLVAKFNGKANISTLPAGVYVVRSIDDKGVATTTKQLAR